MDEVTNAERAERGRAVLQAYHDAVHGHEGGRIEGYDVGDLIADLMHYLAEPENAPPDYEGYPFALHVENGRRHFEAERAGGAQ